MSKIYTTKYYTIDKKVKSIRYSPYPQYITSPYILSKTECSNLILQSQYLYEYYAGARHENKREKDYQSKYEAELGLSSFPSITKHIIRDFTFANKKYKFEVKGIISCISIFSYKEKDHLNNHLDFNYDSVKLSSTTLLSDPSSYKGGEFLLGPQQEEIKLKRGETIIFPSWQVHQINSIIKGERIVMANWAVGPKFR